MLHVPDPMPSAAATGPRPEGWSLQDQILSIRDMLGILVRRRGTILLVIALVTMPAVGFSLWTGPRYTATASVMIEPQVIAGQRSPVASVVDTERDIIRSRTFVKATMADLGLYAADEYRVDPDDPASLKAWLRAWTKKGEAWVTGGAADFIGPPVPPGMIAAAEEARAQERAESRFAKDLSVAQTGESYVLRINFTARDPARAAEVANHVAKLYVKRQLNEKQDAAERAEAWLSARVARMRTDVLEAERQLADLRARYQFRLEKTAARSEGAVLQQELERQAEAKRAAYEAMLGRYYDSRGRVESLAPDARLISRAQVPSDPSSLSPFLIAAVSLTASGAFGCGLALVREQMDRRIRGRRQVEAALQVRCLGLVPRMERWALRTHGPDVMVSAPRCLYSQALRSLGLRCVAAGPWGKVLLVTSALPREGKSAVAAGLAVALHQTTDARVLLVDFDLWHPGIARQFGVDTQAPGLTRLLAGPGTQPATAADPLEKEPPTAHALIVQHAATGVDILPAGPAPQVGKTPPRTAVRALLDALCKDYDHIIVDAPCLLGDADAPLLAPCADATLLVARWGRTNLDVAGAALALLHDVGAPVLGTALTQVDPRRHARHGQDHDLQHFRIASRLSRREKTAQGE